VPSRAYGLFARAIAGRMQVVCSYDGYRRELCPHILGHTRQGDEVVLSYQFGGQSRRGLPPGGEWRCLRVAKAADVRLRHGPWHGGSSHGRPQGCVDIVDLDVNPSSPYRPKGR
jgi:hypothetical protein